jgi:prepilin-type N-terminal cleavage/methylation domain-containing protein
MKSLKKTAGLTLIELLVVIAIVAFMLTITSTFVSSGTSGNNRNSCLINLHNLHQAQSQYTLDFDNPPQFDPTAPPAAHPCAATPLWQGSGGSVAQLGNLGLIALHSYGPTRNDPKSDYLKGTKTLHCPHDEKDPSSPRISSVPQCPDDPNLPAMVNVLNYDWVSYQVFDQVSGEWTYSPFRLYGINNITTVRNDPNYRRQLAVPASCYDTPSTLCGAGGGCAWFNPSTNTWQCRTYAQALTQNVLEFAPKWHAADTTVVTWCMFHRQRARPFDHDNVLFADGSVERLPSTQVCPTLGTFRGSTRVPERLCN